MELTNMNEYINNLDWSKERAINLYYAPAKGKYKEIVMNKAKIIAKNWYYRNANDVILAMTGATAGARLKYKNGYIIAVDVEKNAIVEIIGM